MTDQNTAVTDATPVDGPVDFDPADPEGKTQDAPEGEPESEETAASGDGEGQEEDQPPESSSEKEEGKVPQSRIDEVTKLARTAERERDYWKQRAEENAKAEPDDGPQLEKTLEDFEYDVGAYTKYVAEQTTQHIQSQSEQQRAQAEAQQVLEQHIAREAAFSAEVEDYHQVALNESLRVSPLMADVIRRTEDGPAVLYHLGENPEVSAKISSLPPQLQLLEMGKISNKLATASGPPKSETPAPAKTLAGSKPQTKIRSDHPDSDKLSDEEWKKRELQRMKDRG